MDVSWLTPFPLDPQMAIGVIVSSEDEARNLMEYLPYPLEPEHIDDIMARGPIWLIEQMPEDIPAFLTENEAMLFMLAMNNLHAMHAMTIQAVEFLTAVYRGEWRSKAEYGYELRPLS